MQASSACWSAATHSSNGTISRRKRRCKRSENGANSTRSHSPTDRPRRPGSARAGDRRPPGRVRDDHVRKPPDRSGRIAIVRFQQGDAIMATLRKEIPVAAGAMAVWHALRDFGQVHTKVAPGFLTDLRMDKRRSHRHLLQRPGGARAAGDGRRRDAPAGLCRGRRPARATTTPPSRSSPRATAAASCGRSTSCRTSWRPRSVG